MCVEMLEDSIETIVPQYLHNLNANTGIYPESEVQLSAIVSKSYKIIFLPRNLGSHIADFS